MKMTATYHNPVLLNESIEGLQVRPGGRYVDVTFGGGGHAAKIVSLLNQDGRLYGFDQDPDAAANAFDDERLVLINQNFSFLKNYLTFHKAIPVDGILADLGVSSHQFDTAERGFSTRFDAPLDMRMNQNTDLTAAQVINTYEQESLTTIFKNYGELARAHAIAKHIVSVRSEKTIGTIQELKDATVRFAPRGKENKFYAQLFQALRIEVNQELEVLKKLLNESQQVLKKGGRLVVITYHSLEDRLVKNFINKGKFSGEVEKDFYGNPIKPFAAINRKPIVATEEEINQNSRARSAKLRIAERI
jgi:16S rRNA (cytosine1402-N4)-methyltransferase